MSEKRIMAKMWQGIFQVRMERELTWLNAYHADMRRKKPDKVVHPCDPVMGRRQVDPQG